MLLLPVKATTVQLGRYLLPATLIIGGIRKVQPVAYQATIQRGMRSRIKIGSSAVLWIIDNVRVLKS